MKEGNAAQTQRRRRFVLVFIVVLAVIGYALLTQFSAQTETSPAGQTKSSVQSSQQSGLAIRALGKLAVKERAARTGYSRSQFGDGWAQVDGCDTRNLILQRDLKNTALDSDRCTVLSGVLQADPYTAKTIAFTRGRFTSGAVQIDHVVALSDAWQKGAQDLTPQRRQEFANDSLNLLAVDGPANMQKGDADASDWLPHKSYRCRYVARQIAVKIKFVLWVTRAEQNAMKRVLGTCPNQVLPVEASP